MGYIDKLVKNPGSGHPKVSSMGGTESPILMKEQSKEKPEENPYLKLQGEEPARESERSDTKEEPDDDSNTNFNNAEEVTLFFNQVGLALKKA